MLKNKLFYFVVFAVAAIFATTLVACAPEGDTIIGASYVASEGDAVEWIELGGTGQGWVIAQANGLIPPLTLTGKYYKVGRVVPAASLKTGADSKISLEGINAVAVQVIRVAGETDTTNVGVKAVPSSKELAAVTGAIYAVLPIEGAVLLDANKKLPVSGLTANDVYSVTDYTTAAATGFYVVTAAEVTAGLIDTSAAGSAADVCVYEKLGSGTAMDVNKKLPVANLVAKDVYSVIDYNATTPAVTSYVITAADVTAGLIDTSGKVGAADGNICLYTKLGSGTAMNAAVKLPVSGLVAGDVYSVMDYSRSTPTGASYIITAADVTAGLIDTSSGIASAAEDDICLYAKEESAYLSGTGTSITVTGFNTGDLVKIKALD